MILTDDEIKRIGEGNTGSWQDDLQFARAIESAVLEKLKAQDPVGEVVIFDPLLELFPKKGPHKIIDGSLAFIDSAEIGTKLYTNPLPPADVVRDAERYRWLRDECVPEKNPNHTWIVEAPGDMWDAAIDAAMKEMK